MWDWETPAVLESFRLDALAEKPANLSCNDRISTWRESPPSSRFHRHREVAIRTTGLDGVRNDPDNLA
ncbi:hypothetical protein GCM10010191_57000 [Actinomadura vinacea]|uniref:Uncharacterized protein n=1 Tax=Actinomadura vinacea TaxID=115336 RepID=A0ABN3JQD7_9ACTN